MAHTSIMSSNMPSALGKDESEAAESRGYKPTYQLKATNATILSFDDHGYANDISIAVGSLLDLKIQL